MKKKLSLILAAMMIAGAMYGCGSGSESDVPANDDSTATDISDTVGAAAEEDDKTAKEEPEVKEEPKNERELLAKEDEKISYVMIYNPSLYNETASLNPELNTGSFANQIDPSMEKADGVVEIPEFIPKSQAEINAGVDIDISSLELNRAGAMIAPYSVGDMRSFYHFSPEGERIESDFMCLYAGEKCNIWVNIEDEYADINYIPMLGKEFDEKVYDSVTGMFGSPRFEGNGAKINVLVAEDVPSTAGYFCIYDLFATGEASDAEVLKYGLNLDHPIININSITVNEMFGDIALSTLAHEFQHLICFTSTLESNKCEMMETWFNEAMSGYIEEELYPGIQDDRYDEYMGSNIIRYGQSLYNFATDNSEESFDIGTYGSVFLYSEFLANLAGEDIYTNIHKYWRTSFNSGLDVATAIANSVPKDVYNEIADSVKYGSGIRFNDKDDEWMSKLTLNFYIALLAEEDPEEFAKIITENLLYNDINAADIEGGGRVIIPVKNGKYEIPENADKGLVYIGINKDLEVVTDIYSY
ncbi:MAG: hypothetical protein E7583_06495 [Ruminococcaceae bacterium]|nr:hypothetical protein [Oscillospiraceae bacterium]